MEKPADSTYPIHDLMKRRWSPRAFAERLVEHEKLRSMFEAARWAPSAFNAQPWSFIVATKEDSNVYNRLLHCMPAANQRWAHRAPSYCSLLRIFVNRIRESPIDSRAMISAWRSRTSYCKPLR
jgi:nitroreductase